MTYVGSSIKATKSLLFFEASEAVFFRFIVKKQVKTVGYTRYFHEGEEIFLASYV